MKSLTCVKPLSECSVVPLSVGQLLLVTIVSGPLPIGFVVVQLPDHGTGHLVNRFRTLLCLQNIMKSV